ncbi:hypothetical protein P175DRAFT_0528131 [Aspergillus ochraceoroseus IBT 24754]|uniref:Uncharacterized protein n=1 Tax=Aspergillus ochraceoroseus IBT 24754 TaxID=1392256 RepID=A0A2T5M7X7_9EURO|nr:uncharacterized protein P175DRAFT_0528131 [Aspergillus ochraceoroseus IBT 24754]PTU24634.1 hypothetical protein P175DRAFT_0528131 [Aspergillus ochraceoroseus IBT 24754]
MEIVNSVTLAIKKKRFSKDGFLPRSASEIFKKGWHGVLAFLDIKKRAVSRELKTCIHQLRGDCLKCGGRQSLSIPSQSIASLIAMGAVVSIGGLAQTVAWSSVPDDGDDVGVYHGSVAFDGRTGPVTVSLLRDNKIVHILPPFGPTPTSSTITITPPPYPWSQTSKDTNLNTRSTSWSSGPPKETTTKGGKGAATVEVVIAVVTPTRRNAALGRRKSARRSALPGPGAVVIGIARRRLGAR